MTKTKKRSLLSNIRRWLIRLVLLWLFITVLLVLPLRWFNPPTTAFMLHHQYFAQNNSTELNHEWRDLEHIAPSLAMSVIASEDQKFADHWGFDIAAIEQVLEDRQAGKKMRGASTLSQQLAKNLFLWSGRSWARKGLEAYFTAAIEIMIPKQRILELYLNVAEFGEDIYGAEAAAQSIFGIPADSLYNYQSALLAARLPAPKSYDIQPPSDYMKQRAQWIEKQIKQLGGEGYLNRL